MAGYSQCYSTFQAVSCSQRKDQPQFSASLGSVSTFVNWRDDAQIPRSHKTQGCLKNLPNKGCYIVYCDSYYTTKVLADYLSKNGYGFALAMNARRDSDWQKLKQKLKNKERMTVRMLRRNSARAKKCNILLHNFVSHNNHIKTTPYNNHLQKYLQVTCRRKFGAHWLPNLDQQRSFVQNEFTSK